MRRKALLPAAILLGAGCCSWPRPPDPDRYFDRGEPRSAFRYFQYCLEAAYWDRAYGSLYLAEEDREELTPFRFRFAVKRIPLEAFDGQTLREVAAGIRDVFLEGIAGDEGRLVVFSDSELPVAFQQRVILRRAGDVWQVDLRATAETLFARPEALP